MLAQENAGWQEVVQVIENATAAEASYESELRDQERQKVMLPVEVVSQAKQLHGFSRNLSANGICVVTHQPIQAGTEAVLRLGQPDGELSSLIAICKWSKAFGAAHCSSGWQFTGIA